MKRAVGHTDVYQAQLDHFRASLAKWRCETIPATQRELVASTGTPHHPALSQMHGTRRVLDTWARQPRTRDGGHTWRVLTSTSSVTARHRAGGARSAHAPSTLDCDAFTTRNTCRAFGIAAALQRHGRICRRRNPKPKRYSGTYVQVVVAATATLA